MRRGFLNLRVVEGKDRLWGRPTVLILNSRNGTYGGSGGIRETCASTDYYESI
jgi:hypothetical protein